MRVYYDTEFLERGYQYPVELISVGLVADDGRELYLINGDMELPAIARHTWLMDHVVPHLPLLVPTDPEISEFVGGLMWDFDHPEFDAHVFNRRGIREKLAEFFDNTPRLELWSYCGPYDHVVLAQSFGDMDGRHPKMPYHTNDIAQEMGRAKIRHDSLPIQTGTNHRAIDDARWHRESHLWLMDFTAE